MKKRGSVIMVAVILGAVFFIVVSGLLRFSSSEMKHVKAISAIRKAELLALSGIDWAESELRKGRWYQKEFRPYEITKGVHPTHGVKELYPFGSSEGKVTIVCEDIANKTPGSDIRGMQKLWFLHHINVFAMGEFENQRVLVYGRYIISPEPALNSNSTEASIYESPEFGDPRSAPVMIEKAMVNGNETTEFVVKRIQAAVNQSVDINSVVAIVSPLNGTGLLPMRPRYAGRVKEILLEEGQTCRAGDVFAVLSRPLITTSGSADSRTLKKMVRVTKIEPSVWRGRFDILKRNDRFALSQYVGGLSDAYLQNFVAHNALEKAIEAMGSAKPASKIDAKDLLAHFPADVTNTTRNRAENMFLAYMIQKFTVPGGTWTRKEASLERTYLELDHPRSTKPPQDLVDWLRELNLGYLLNTRPRVDPRYYEPKMKSAEFIKLLKPQFNVDPTIFIEQLSQLKDASRYVDIEEGPYSDSQPAYKETEDGIEIIKPDKGVKVTVEKFTKDYTFVDPITGFSIKMTDLMGFLRKYYDDSGSEAPREDVRTLQHIDWPMPKPAPPPPAPRPNGTWVWNPGTPGVPQGDPIWVPRNSKVIEFPAPVGGGRDYEPVSGSPDGGFKDYRIAGIDPKSTEDGNSQGGNDSTPSNSQFRDIKPPIEIEHSDWRGTPGSAGVPPSDGSYDWRENPPPPSGDSDSTCKECKSCCFAAGTLILMADGSHKAIEEVAVGDQVKCYDEDGRAMADGRVDALERPMRDHLATLRLKGHANLVLTEEHPLLTPEGWASIDPDFTLTHHHMQVLPLSKGSKVFNNEKKWVEIESISRIATDTRVYNLAKVSPFPNFFAGGILAHNKPPGSCEVCNPPGGPEAGGNADNLSGNDGPGSDGSAQQDGAQSPGGGEGNATGNDGTSGPGGAGGTGTSTSGAPPGAGGSGTTSDGTSGGVSSPGGSGSNSNTGFPGGGQTGGSSPGTNTSGGYPRPSTSGSSGGGSSPSYSPPRRTGGGF